MVSLTSSATISSELPLPISNLASEPPSTQMDLKHLNDAFSRIVYHLNLTERQILSDAVETLYIRRTLGQNLSHIPSRFYDLDDDDIERIGRSHLWRWTRPDVTSDHQNGEQFCWANESKLVEKMSEELKNEFLLARYYGDKAECMELGAKYLLHLKHPHLPLEVTVKKQDDEDCESEFDGEAKWDSDSDVASEISNVTQEECSATGSKAGPS